MNPVAHVPYPHTLSFEAFKKEKLNKIYFPPTHGLSVIFPTKGRYRGTIKLHGTNATMIFRNDNIASPTYQSRNRVITKDHDNQGTVALLLEAGVEPLVENIIRISGSQSFNEVMIAGELGGKGIQKAVGIAEMERFFCIFNIRIDGAWVDMAQYASVHIPQKRIFNIMQYQTFEVEIDLRGNTGKIYEQLMSYTAKVGAKCPFASAFFDETGNSISGGGEGIVWTLIPEDWHDQALKLELANFKTKTETFTTTTRQPKTPKSTNVTALMPANKFVDYAVNERRLEQGVEYMREMKKVIGVQNFGSFLTWVIRDTLREEGAVMKEMGADEKVVKKVITGKARAFWFNKCLDEK